MTGRKRSGRRMREVTRTTHYWSATTPIPSSHYDDDDEAGDDIETFSPLRPLLLFDACV
jgi:hypothetical protein